jgi:hypothetical protein
MFKVGKYTFTHKKVRLVLATALEEGMVVDLNYDSDGHRVTDGAFMQAVVTEVRTSNAKGGFTVITFAKPSIHSEEQHDGKKWVNHMEVWNEPHPSDSLVRYRVVAQLG